MALEGGAAVIDVKEPARGSLGMADPKVIQEIVEVASPLRPVSAALGELCEWNEDRRQSLPDGLTYAKIGFSGLGRDSALPAKAREFCARLGLTPKKCIAAGYADWQRAGSPPPDEVVKAAIDWGWTGVLLDTWIKDGRSLDEWVDIEHLSRLREQCRKNGLSFALAGSLNAECIRRLLVVGPDLFAVRGAACRGGKREAAIDPAAVRSLAQLLNGA